MERIHPLSRILVAIAALSIGAMLVLPIWRIDLMAPQYPEGLVIQIFHDRFTGDIQKINGLNHYIGMATIENEMFPEFTIMRYAFYLLIAWGLAAALMGRNAGLFSWLVGLGAYVTWAMWDMYSWGYKYGHDLDPRAAIKVEGMAYQPPLFGHKKLLNFDAWSLPDTGGWVLFGVIMTAFLVWFVEWRRAHKRTAPVERKAELQPAVAAGVLLLIGSITSCAPAGPPAVPYGQAECTSCRMNVMDRQFAAAIVTLKDRTYYFDSPECMVQHVADGGIAEEQVKAWWVCDHAHPGVLIDATTAFYLHSTALHSPMNGNTAAFGSEGDRRSASAAHGGEALDWSGARTRLADH